MIKRQIWKICLVLLLLVGCQSKDASKGELNKITLDVKEAMVQIASSSEFISTFEVTEDYFVENLSYEPQDGITVSGMFGSVLDANRVVIFEVTTEENKNYVLNYVEVMKSRIVDAMLDDMDAEKELIKNGLVLSEANYIVFISGEKAQTGSEAFQELVK